MSEFLWHFRVQQEGMVVASGSTAERAAALREMRHYAMVYGQDGPVTTQMRTGKNRWKDAA